MASKRSLSRREILELAAASGLTATLAGGAYARPQADETPRVKPDRPPRNIIFMVADGMSLGVPSMAEPFSQLVRNRGTRWYELLQSERAAAGFFETHSLSSLVTDSSAASCAWASGSRIYNGAVNVLPDGTKLTPIGPLVIDSGRRLGLVTTTRITHATPAGFCSVVPSRDQENDIAAQYLDHRVDVLLGGGTEQFDPASRGDHRDLWADFAQQGYAVVKSRAELQQVNGAERLLGVFYQGHLPYTLDHRNRPALQQQVPTLAEMTRAALALLSRDDRGFLLQVEGGRVDHAAHGNDAAAQLWDQLAFDDAIEVALSFAAEHPNTLIVITADHGNSNPGLNGVGGGYNGSAEAFARLALATSSYEWLAKTIAQEKSDEGLPPERLAEVLRQAFGFDLKADELAAVNEALHGQMPAELSDHHRNLVGIMGQVLGNHTGVGWTSVSHTEDWVLLTATGPGSEGFNGLLRNTDAFVRMTDLFGIRHRNPSMTKEAARKFAIAPQATRPHWA